jgi:predicted transcriptional regulator
MTNDDTTKAAAIYMLERGLATVAEITELSGRSRQIVRHWAKEYPDARPERLRKLWAKALLSADKNR